MSRRLRILPLALLLGALSAPLVAQHPNHDQGFRPARAYDASGIEHVSLLNGNLTLTIPLGTTYPLGPELSYGAVLTWSGNPWTWDEATDPATGQPYLQAQPRTLSNAGFGWDLSLGRIVPASDPANPNPHPAYMGPDQALHALALGPLHLGKESFPGIRFSHDSTYLRRIEDRVEFPDGTIRTFLPSGRLASLRDRFQNELTITYSNFSGTDPLLWRLEDSHGRVHRIEFVKLLGRAVVRTVRLAKFGGGTAVYDFSYATDVSLPRACNVPVDCDGTPCGDTSNVTLPLLTRVELPDATAYAMPKARYHRSTALCTTQDGPGERQLTGSLERLELPTAGAFEYTWQSWKFPVESATLPPGEGTPGGAASPFRRSAGLAERRRIRRSGAVQGRWEYEPKLHTDVANRELGVTVTDPTGDSTKHYFSVYAEPLDLSSGWTRDEYGLPFTHRVSDGTSPGRLLSREVFDRHGTKLRSVYVRFEESGFGQNPRLVSQRTRYHDDGNRVADVDLSDFDGLGHHRRVTTGGTFPEENVRITTTHWNPGHDVGNIPDETEPWVLDVFNQTKVEEGGQTIVRDYHFEEATGHLARVRIRERKNGLCSGEDVIQRRIKLGTGSPFGPPGFVRHEELHGGDGASLSCVALETVPLGTPRFRRRHAYACGVLRSTEWLRPNGTVELQSLDRTIDCPSGLAAKSRDPADLETVFTYDELGRLRTATPGAGEAQLKHSYPKPTATLGARVVTERLVGATKLTGGQVELDGFGRPVRETRELPEDREAERSQTWNARGDLLTRTEWHDRQSPPAGTTVWSQYDPFGRPGKITLPDGQEIQIVHTGDSVRTIGVPVATGTGLNTAVTREIHDRFGRLVRLREPNGTRTSYDYDPMGNLTRVEMNDLGFPTQTRSFTYDGRGFLTSETHPELGTAVVYSDYDPLGNPRRIQRGGWDLRYSYDAAGRLREIRENGTSRVWKEWVYATDNLQLGEFGKGKLRSAVRHNRVIIPGTTTEFDATVTEDYEYDGVGGRLDHVTTTVGTGDPGPANTRPVFEYSLGYDPLGNVTSRGQPRCEFNFCSGSPNIVDRTITHSYTRGLLTRVPNFAESLTYHPNGLVHRIDRPGPVFDVQENDPHDLARPLRLRTLEASTDFDTGDFEYDGAGNVTAMGSNRFRYDLLSRVVEAEVSTVSETCGDDLHFEFETFTTTTTEEVCGEIETGQQVTITSDGNVTFRAGERIVLGDGFQVASGGRFVAEVDPDLLPGGGESEATWEGAYDLFGNLTSITTRRPGQSSVTRTPVADPETNRLTAVGTAYDLSGNVEARPGWEYSYDPFNMPWQAKRTGGNGFTFVYGPGDERLLTLDWTAGTGTQHWVETWTLRDLDGRPLRQLRQQGGNTDDDHWTFLRDYVWRGGGLLGAFTPQGLRYTHLDHLGTPRLVTDPNGATRAYHAYFPFGEEATSPTDSIVPLQYTGHERDNLDPGGTGADLDYMHARYFSAHLGRFQSVDPVGFAPNWPQSWNRYAYTLGNPLKYTDPEGLLPIVYDQIDVTASFFRFTSPYLLDFLYSLEGATDSIAGLFGWITGRLPSVGLATPAMTWQLSRTPGADNIREAYKRDGCQDGLYSTDFQYPELVTTTNVTGQLVGGFVAQVTSVGGGMIVVDARNTWGLESATRDPRAVGFLQPFLGANNRKNASIQQMLFDGAPLQYPKSILENRFSGPMKNAELHYIWAEPSPCN